MGLGPHGGMHNPQVLHSDQEPFPAKRGEVPESDLEVLVGGVVRERLQGHGVCGRESESPCPCTGCPTLTAWSLGALTGAALDVVAVPDILLFPNTSLSVKFAALADPGACLLAWDLLAADVFNVWADAVAPLSPEPPLSIHCRDRGSWACTKEGSQ